jgi:hypothetical protein
VPRMVERTLNCECKLAGEASTDTAATPKGIDAHSGKDCSFPSTTTVEGLYGSFLRLPKLAPPREEETLRIASSSAKALASVVVPSPREATHLFYLRNMTN